MEKFKEFLRKTLFNETWTCNLCDREIFEGYFCQDCIEKLPFNNKDICFHCGRKVSVPTNNCVTCKNKLVSIDKGRSVFEYKDEIAMLIQKFKFENKRYLAKAFAFYLEKEYLKGYFNADFITYIPMSDKRLKERGYNQTELLAKELSIRVGVPVKQVLQKEKETPHQVGLTREERFKNLSGSFKVINKKELTDKTVLIVDDVTTTGATGEVVAELLKRKGAEKVYLLTVASVGEVKPENKE